MGRLAAAKTTFVACEAAAQSFRVAVICHKLPPLHKGAYKLF